MKGLIMRKSRVYVLLALLLGLSAVYVFLISPPSQTIENPSAKEEYVFKENQNDIHSITIAKAKEELVIEKTVGENQNEWKIHGLDDHEVDVFKILVLINSIANIKATDVVVDNQENLHIYGLDSSAAKISIKRTNGEVRDLLVGNKLPTGNGYYFFADGENKIFIVDSEVAKLFRTNADELLKTDQVVVDGTEFKEITYQKYGEEKIVIRAYEGRASSQYSGYYMAEPYATKPQLDDMSEDFVLIISTLASTPTVETIEADSKDLGKYGLEKPAVYLKIETQDGKMRSLAIGDEYKAGFYYALFDDKATVYAITTPDSMDIFNVQPFDLTITAPVFTFIHHVKSIEIANHDQVYKMEYEKLDDTPNPVMNFTMNGLEAEESKMRAFYISLMELKADAESEKEADNEEVEMKMKITYEDNTETTIEYAPYDRNFYAIYQDGKNDFVIAKKKLIS